MTQSEHLVAVIGAGPAGLFAARELAAQGAQVWLFNRDVRPGGLAEYGIYPFKYRMKEGLRAQFRQILGLPGVHYFGNITFGARGDLTLDDLRSLGVQAILVAVGAQSNKWLGLPGEHLKGVYHAKDIVYHYNGLPPYSQQAPAIGKHVAVVGVGNVMLDVTHWLLDVKDVEEVIAVARRGPAEIKFDKKELESVVGALDLTEVEMEIRRVTADMLRVGQDPEAVRAFLRSVLEKAGPSTHPNAFKIQFLASPSRILSDRHGRVRALEVEETMLIRQPNGDTAARGMGVHHTLAVDTVIFAIGDRVDSHFGLPVDGNEFVKAPAPRYPIEGVSYEAYAPDHEAIIQDVFVAGWARKASTGLVGVARKDGINGARAILQYLETLPPAAPGADALLSARLAGLGKPVVTEEDLPRLEAAEREQAAAKGLEYFRYTDNLEMLQAMGLLNPLMR